MGIVGTRTQDRLLAQRPAKLVDYFAGALADTFGRIAKLLAGLFGSLPKRLDSLLNPLLHPADGIAHLP